MNSYKIILNGKFPFGANLPTAKPTNVSEMTEVELNAEIEKGYADMMAGKTKPAKQTFADIRKG